jgi:hypothetical protein
VVLGWFWLYAGAGVTSMFAYRAFTGTLPVQFNNVLPPEAIGFVVGVAWAGFVLGCLLPPK